MRTVDTTTAVPRLLSVRDVERVLGIKCWRIYELISRGQGPDHLRIGKTIRIAESALNRWIAEREAAERKPGTVVKR